MKFKPGDIVTGNYGGHNILIPGYDLWPAKVIRENAFPGVWITDKPYEVIHEDMIQGNPGWVGKYFSIVRKARPEEILKVLIKFKNERIRESLKKLLKERL